jgi:putative DNA primase/helicase
MTKPKLKSCTKSTEQTDPPLSPFAQNAAIADVSVTNVDPGARDEVRTASSEKVMTFNRPSSQPRKRRAGRTADGSDMPPSRPAELGEKSPPYKQFADAICAADHFARDAGGRLYRFGHGVYKPDGEAWVKRRVKHLVVLWDEPNKWSRGCADAVVEYIRVDAPELWERPPVDVLNVENGLLDVNTGELQPHRPDFLSSIQLPVTHDRDATCPAWDAFIAAVFPEDTLDLAYELPAWLMVPDRSIQKAALLLGAGANGKSTYLTALRAFLGPRNVSGVSLHKLESDRFAAARLVGKLANICPDLPSAHLAGTSIFKQITGGDTITAEYKFKDTFDHVPIAGLVFSANEPPRSADAAYAFFRRWLVVPFTRTFEPNEQVRRSELDARLSAPPELSGLLNKALQALKDIRARGGLLESISMRAASAEFRATTDPLAVWLELHIVEAADANVAKQDLLTAFNAYAAQIGAAVMTANAFGRALHSLQPGLQDAQRTVNGEIQWVWLGVKLRS